MNTTDYPKTRQIKVEVPKVVVEHLDAQRLVRQLKTMEECSGPPRSADGFVADQPPK